MVLPLALLWLILASLKSMLSSAIDTSKILAKLANAPFIKVEATKFTEVGYVGRDVETIIRDLVDISLKMTREQETKKVQFRAEDIAEERLLDALLTPARDTHVDMDSSSKTNSATRQIFRKKLREGDLDDKEIEIELAQVSIGVEIMSPPGMEEMTNQLQSMFSNMGGQKKTTQRLTVKDAYKALIDDEAAKLVNEEDIKQKAIYAVEQNGIVFLDEIDKVCRRTDAGSSGGDVSREGVQRDLLPLIEGCTLSTKYGMIKTDHILFIASGAFHLAKPSDLIPELQGRLPIRVELNALTSDDFRRILIEPKASLTEQYRALMNTEGVTISFSNKGIARIAELAFQVNEQTENIGARRLHTMMERLLEELSFNASDNPGEELLIDTDYVNKHLAQVSQDEELSHYFL